MLDVGTGTGILARIARARGAAFVAATDIDPAALAAASAHFALDGATRGEILLGDQAPDHWGARFDLTVANILESPLRELAGALADSLAAGGTLLTSGYTRAQGPALREIFRARGLAHVTDATLEEWVLSTFRRAP